MPITTTITSKAAAHAAAFATAKQQALENYRFADSFALVEEKLKANRIATACIGGAKSALADLQQLAMQLDDHDLARLVGDWTDDLDDVDGKVQRQDEKLQQDAARKARLLREAAEQREQGGGSFRV